MLLCISYDRGIGMKCKFCEKDFKNWGRDRFCSYRCKILAQIKIEKDCWIWQGTINKSGYGYVNYEGKEVKAHRASYEIFKEKIKDNMHVCHSCDNRACVNPEHLWLGTPFQNMRDAAKKRRLPGPAKWSEEKKKAMKGKIKIPDNRGEKSGLSKLKESDIYEIRDLLTGGMSLSQIGKKFGMSSGSISRIKNRKRWAHI